MRSGGGWVWGLRAEGCLASKEPATEWDSIQPFPNSPILPLPQPYLVLWDTLCSCEAYGMKPKHTENNMAAVGVFGPGKRGAEAKSDTHGEREDWVCAWKSWHSGQQSGCWAVQ